MEKTLHWTISAVKVNQIRTRQVSIWDGESLSTLVLGKFKRK